MTQRHLDMAKSSGARKCNQRQMSMEKAITECMDGALSGREVRNRLREGYPDISREEREVMVMTMRATARVMARQVMETEGGDRNQRIRMQMWRGSYWERPPPSDEGKEQQETEVEDDRKRRKEEDPDDMECEDELPTVAFN